MAFKPSELQKVVQAAAPAELELLFRPMFGGIGVYAYGRTFCTLSDVGLALKLFGADHTELLKLRGAKALQYEPSMPPSKSYVLVPDAVLEDRKLLHSWLVRSADGVRSARARKPMKKRHKSAAASR